LVLGELHLVGLEQLLFFIRLHLRVGAVELALELVHLEDLVPAEVRAELVEVMEQLPKVLVGAQLLVMILQVAAAVQVKQVIQMAKVKAVTVFFPPLLGHQFKELAAAAAAPIYRQVELLVVLEVAVLLAQHL
jgi:hypothetical protein